MFSLFKKGKEVKGVVAPVSGICINIADVSDQVFASKAMGDGYAVKPEDDQICAPVTGEITMLFPTKHAFGMKTKSGIEVLVHIGIDTVSLNGVGFKAIAKEGDKVNAGDPVVTVDRAALEAKGIDLTTMVVFTDGYDKEINLEYYGKKVDAGQLLIEA